MAADRVGPGLDGRSVVVLAVLVVACGPASAPGVGRVTVEAPARVVDAGPGLPPDVEGVVEVARPDSRCRITRTVWEPTAPWDREGGQRLRVSAGGAVYARVPSGRAAELSLVPPGLGFLSVDTGSAHVGGFVGLDGVRVTTRAAVVFGGVFAPSRGRPSLSIVDVVGDRLTLLADAPDGLALPGLMGLVKDVACGDVALDAADTDGSVAVDSSAPLRRVLLLVNRPIALSVEPTGAPVAEIRVGESRGASVLEERAGHSRIAWAAATGTVFGWVATRDLLPLPAARPPSSAATTDDAAQVGTIGLLGTSAAESPPGAPEAGEERLECERPVRILAEVGGYRHAVGHIAARAPFVIHRREGPVSTLVTPGSLEPAPGVALVVPSRDVVGCASERAAEARDPASDRAVAADPGSVPAEHPGPALSGASVDAGAPTKAPRLREGAISVGEGLPTEVVRRIVRQSHGRFRLCYENGLRRKPGLRGRVTVRFVVDRSGAVVSTAAPDPELPDREVVRCLLGAFAGLSFPQPDGATVAVPVTYPMRFDPGD